MATRRCGGAKGLRPFELASPDAIGLDRIPERDTPRRIAADPERASAPWILLEYETDVRKMNLNAPCT